MNLLIDKVGSANAVSLLTDRWPQDLSFAVREGHGVFSGSPEALIFVLGVITSFTVYNEKGEAASHAELTSTFQRTIRSRRTPGVSDFVADDGIFARH